MLDDKQIQKLLLTDAQSQLQLLQFYKSNWERERKRLKEQKEGKSELSSVKKSAGDGENRPQYISVVSHRDTELERSLDDKVMLSDFLTEDQLGSRLEYEGSRRRSLQGRRHRSEQNNSNSNTNESTSSHVEREVQSKQRQKEGDMERSDPNGEGSSKTTVPVFLLERILEKQERETDEDRKNEGDKRDERGTKTVVVQDFPELQEGSLQQGQPGGERAEPSCPVARQLPGWLRGSAAGSAPQCKSQDEVQLEVGPMDEGDSSWAKEQVLEIERVRPHLGTLHLPTPSQRTRHPSLSDEGDSLREGRWKKVWEGLKSNNWIDVEILV